MEIIDLDKIDTNDVRYSISYPVEDERLRAAISRFGLLNPVGLFDSSQPIVVTGFKRIEVAKSLGITRIPCVFLGLREKDALLAAINDNISRTLNTVEKAHAIFKMSQMNLPDVDIEAVIDALGLPRKRAIRATAASIAEMDEGFKSFLVRHNVSFLHAEQLLWFQGDDRLMTADLLDAARPSASLFREILHLLMLAKAKKGTIDFRSLRGATEAVDLRRRMKLITHPRLCEMETNLTEILRSCALPPEIKIGVDQSFERDWVDISIKIRRTTDLAQAIKKLESVEEAGYLRRILDLTRGTSDRD
jgi:ParB-like chromosome segregation protein Spo0J